MSNYERGYNHGCRDTLSKVVVTKDRERAVIEASEALAALHGAILDGQPVSGEAMSDALERNYDAVRALQEARDE
ncbi:MAG TPA: hypothetical protein VM487_03925 [Phycisphaerae bacterium]|nr:hypothetical protein [Phycisphaerae bacterium]HUU94864.1 hypothetical protein [Phycisphaerae bacterium]